MKKNIIKKLLVGYLFGIAIGHILSIVFSIILTNGTHFSPTSPLLTQHMGGELKAVIFQTILSGVLGSICNASSLIWTVEKWGLTKQTVLSFLALAGTLLPISYLNYWMEHSLGGFLGYSLIFVFIYLSIWLSQYLAWKYELKKINSKLN